MCPTPVPAACEVAHIAIYLQKAHGHLSNSMQGWQTDTVCARIWQRTSCLRGSANDSATASVFLTDRHRRCDATGEEALRYSARVITVPRICGRKDAALARGVRTTYRPMHQAIDNTRVPARSRARILSCCSSSRLANHQPPAAKLPRVFF